MSRSQSSAVNVDWENLSRWDRLPAWKKRRRRRLAIEVYTAYRAYNANPDTPENPPSFTTCERSHTPGETDSTGGETPDSGSSDLRTFESELISPVLQMGVEDTDRAAEIVEGLDGDGATALYAALEREKQRQWKVLALLERGNISHALKLAMCERQSVQLVCPEHAGGCGCEENYAPTTCDSRLCPNCNDRKAGQNIEQYTDAVFDMDQVSFFTFTIENVENPVTGREDMMESLGTFRRRTIPVEGSTDRWVSKGTEQTTGARHREVAERVEKSWSWWEGTRVEDVEEDHVQWKMELQKNGQHDLVRRLQKQYVNYEYTDITGTHVGRNIPIDELISGGLYGIDIKQKGPSEFNVHAHVLADAAYIPQAALSAVWEDITGDPVVDVRRVYDRSSKESVEDVLSETVGYATKPPEFEELDDELDFVEAAKGCPMVHPFGDLHGSGSASESGMLICSNCERIPGEWVYNGIVDEPRDNMGKSWETDRGKDPPE